FRSPRPAVPQPSAMAPASASPPLVLGLPALGPQAPRSSPSTSTPTPLLAPNLTPTPTPTPTPLLASCLHSNPVPVTMATLVTPAPLPPCCYRYSRPPCSAPWIPKLDFHDHEGSGTASRTRSFMIMKTSANRRVHHDPEGSLVARTKDPSGS